MSRRFAVFLQNLRRRHVKLILLQSSLCSTMWVIYRLFSNSITADLFPQLNRCTSYFLVQNNRIKLKPQKLIINLLILAESLSAPRHRSTLNLLCLTSLSTKVLEGTFIHSQSTANVM